ncbi:hypothetical protein POSPLADRAFT_1058240 [Postia placenta MAD-698-R-SB12]|uniref:Uncharacterized protein n=1 Tax=Postia placenta MAD-698-R-SB12 TaxID=670580 RepID=A0A1X6MYA8_9APHY|nr:hypothetical protein POSPLADRAFT_1058240 [Postia placenta MAD-698-R-SB12]OSX61327.1 hypothetical protein POSPLADRAFT_1058240 [Postia placenta MAD-698-R-SB12]
MLLVKKRCRQERKTLQVLTLPEEIAKRTGDLDGELLELYPLEMDVQLAKPMNVQALGTFFGNEIETETQA